MREKVSTCVICLIIEHQYLFAVNTISCVKSDAFFFYQPPLNLIEWTLHPLCYVLPRRRFIKLNRYIIKAIHLPFLVAIYCFERFYLGSKAVSGFIPLQRVSSFETLANGFVSKQTIKNGSIPKPRGGYRRESIATQAAQHVLDEVFRNSIRGHRNGGNGIYYGAVKQETVKPRTVDWIQEIPTPVIPPRSSMGVHAAPPFLSISAASDGESTCKPISTDVNLPRRRRHVSLASTVIESDEESDKPQSRKWITTRQTVEDDDGDDEYDEANAVLEEEDGIEKVALPGPLSANPFLRQPMSRSPSRKDIPKLVRQHSRRSRSPAKRRSGRPRQAIAGVEERETSVEAGSVDHSSLREKLASLERLVEDIRRTLDGQSA